VKKYCGVDLYLGGDLVLRSLKPIGESVFRHPRWGPVSEMRLSLSVGEGDVVIESVLQDMRMAGFLDFELRCESSRCKFVGRCDFIERIGSERRIHIMRQVDARLADMWQRRLTELAQGTR